MLYNNTDVSRSQDMSFDVDYVTKVYEPLNRKEMKLSHLFLVLHCYNVV